MWSLILLSVALSIDSLTVGMTYGFRKVKIPFRSLLILLFCAFGILYVSVWIGKGFTHIFSEQMATFIGGFILVCLGSWMLYQKAKELELKEADILKEKEVKENKVYRFEIRAFGFVVQILKTPTLADFDRSGRITGMEAFVLGVALSLDSLGAGIGIGVLGRHRFVIGLFVAVMSVLFLKLGVELGNQFACFKKMSHLSVFSGIFLIVLGFLRM